MELEYYADGKERSRTDKIKEIERVFGISRISPFGTSNKDVFKEKLGKMTLKEKARLAEKLGVLKAANDVEQEKFLWEAFTDYSRRNGDPAGERVDNVSTPKEVKLSEQAREVLEKTRMKTRLEKEFPTIHSEEKFSEILSSFSLADLRNLAAKLGFNPSFDKNRLVKLLKNEFSNDLKKRVVV